MSAGVHRRAGLFEVMRAVAMVAAAGLFVPSPAFAQGGGRAAGRGQAGLGPSVGDSTASRAAVPLQRRRSLSLTLSAGSQHESNVRFGGLATPRDSQQLSDSYHLVAAGLVAALANPRQELRFDARGDVARFTVLRDLDRETYDLGGQFTRRWSARLSSLSGIRAVTSTGIVGGDATASTLLPLVITRTESAVQSLVLRTGEQASVTTTLDASRVRFDDRALAGGFTVAAQLQARAATGVRSSRAWLVEVRRIEFDTLPLATASSELEWQHPMGHGRWTLRVGATAVGQRSSSTPLWTDSLQVEPSGSLTIEQPIGRDYLTVRAGRDVRAGFGFGRALLTDDASLAYTHVRPRSASLTLTVDGNQSVDPFNPRLRLRSYGANAELRRDLGAATVAASGFARRRYDGVEVDNFGASLQVRVAMGRTP